MYFVSNGHQANSAMASGSSGVTVDQSALHVTLRKVPMITVYITGYVRRPGLYHLPLDARVDDAVNAAGGATSEADLSAINMAAIVDDGMQVVVPDRASAVPSSNQSGAVGSQRVGSSVSVIQMSRSHSTHRKHKLQSGERIPLNKASIVMLQELPGIGPKKAQAIYQYRQVHKLFTSLDQLRLVQGIGTKLLAKILPFLTL